MIHLNQEALFVRRSAAAASVIAAILAVIIFICTGCSIPATKISLDRTRGMVTIKSPKNTCIEGFEASYQTNGAFTAKFKKWISTNDAQVIDRQAAGDAARIQALGDLSDKLSKNNPYAKP